VHPKQLANTTADTVGIVRRCLQELKDAGYATLEAISTSNGKFGGTEWVIHELPAEIALSRDSANPNLDKGTPILMTESQQKTELRGRHPPIAKEAALLFGESLGMTTEQVEAWWDYHAADGWMQTKTKPIVDAEASLRTWKRKDKEFAARAAPTRAPNLARMYDSQLRALRADLIDQGNVIFREYGKNPQGAVGEKKMKLWKQRKEIEAELEKRRKQR
jgi:hypothetical protein